MAAKRKKKPVDLEVRAWHAEELEMNARRAESRGPVRDLESAIALARRVVRDESLARENDAGFLLREVTARYGLDRDVVLAAARGSTSERAIVLACYFVAISDDVVNDDDARGFVDDTWTRVIEERLLEHRDPSEQRAVFLQAFDRYARGERARSLRMIETLFEPVPKDLKKNLDELVEAWWRSRGNAPAGKVGKWTQIERLFRGTPLAMKESKKEEKLAADLWSKLGQRLGLPNLDERP